jgi:hypothetical protein
MGVAADFDVDLEAAQGAAPYVLDLDPDGELEGGHPPLEQGDRNAQVEKGGEDHVAAQAGRRLEIDVTHGLRIAQNGDAHKKPPLIPISDVRFFSGKKGTWISVTFLGKIPFEG